MTNYIIVGAICFVVGTYVGMALLSMLISSKDGKDDES